MRQVLDIMDEHTARETSKHVKRSMIANARNGFLNGTSPPYGYRTIIAETRGKKQKKKLKIDAVESVLVNQIYRLAETGSGTSGPLGVKAIVNWLHENGYRTRRGNAWHVQTVHAILTGTIYKRVHWFNMTCSKLRQPRPIEGHISVEMPAIIEPDQWERVQNILRSKNPNISPQRSSPGRFF